MAPFQRWVNALACPSDSYFPQCGCQFTSLCRSWLPGSVVSLTAHVLKTQDSKMNTRLVISEEHLWISSNTQIAQPYKHSGCVQPPPNYSDCSVEDMCTVYLHTWPYNVMSQQGYRFGGKRGNRKGKRVAVAGIPILPGTVPPAISFSGRWQSCSTSIFMVLVWIKDQRTLWVCKFTTRCCKTWSLINYRFWTFRPTPLFKRNRPHWSWEHRYINKWLINDRNGRICVGKALDFFMNPCFHYCFNQAAVYQHTGIPC